MEKAVSLSGPLVMGAARKTTVTVMDTQTRFIQLQFHQQLKTRTFHGTQSTASLPWLLHTHRAPIPRRKR